MVSTKKQRIIHITNFINLVTVTITVEENI